MTLVLTMGIAVLDTVFRLAEMPREATKFYASNRAEVVGGIAANASIAICRLGGRALLASRLGDDVPGEQIARILGADGVDMALVEWINGGKSPVSAILVDDAGERLLVNHTDLSIFRGPPADLAGIEVDAVMADTCWPEGAVAALLLARRAGKPGVLDYDRKASALEDEMLQAASHVVFGRQGLEMFSGSGDIEEGLRRARPRTSSWLACTSGGDGVYWLDGARLRHMPAFPITPADTLGAGDVFHAALALALGEGQAIEPALRFANGAAAIKCTRFGGGSGSPTRAELERFLKEAG